MLLFVGQLLPHKRPDLLVKAMHVAATYFGVEARLLLVGQNRFARYADAVSAQIRELNLANVHVVGLGGGRAARGDVPARGRVRDRERARRLLRAAARGDGLRRPGRRPRVRGDPRNRRRGRAAAARRGPAPSSSRRRSHASWMTSICAASCEPAGGDRLRELTEIDASVAMLEAICEVV